MWNNDDVFGILKDSLVAEGLPPKFISLPIPMYSTFQNDSVTIGGKHIGVSQWVSYSANAHAMLSSVLLDIRHAEPGTEVVLHWGEPNSRRAPVERHEVREIRATVAAVPYFEKLIQIGP